MSLRESRLTGATIHSTKLKVKVLFSELFLSQKYRCCFLTVMNNYAKNLLIRLIYLNFFPSSIFDLTETIFKRKIYLRV